VRRQPGTLLKAAAGPFERTCPPISNHDMSMPHLHRIRIRSLPALLAMILGAVAAGAAPPRPHASASAPTLAQTLLFIQDKLSSQPATVYKRHLTSDYEHKEVIVEDERLLSDVRVYAQDCSFSFHWTGSITMAGQPKHTYTDQDDTVALAAVETVEVLPEEEDLRRSEKPGAYRVTQVDPPVTALLIHMTDGKDTFTLYFHDPDLADRVAKAIVHAVELCGGGDHEPF
jgi:hypothetical protein